MSEAVVNEAGGVAEDHANGQSSPEQTSTPTSPSVQAKSKVDILLKSTGDAPIMKKKKWTVDRTKKLAYVSDFIRKFLKLDAQESLFIYVAQAFAPALDTELGTIYENYGSDNKLILHYCKTQAWG